MLAEGLCYHNGMTWKNPINRKEKKEFLNENRFYDLLAEKSNYVDRETASVFYGGLVQLVFEEIRRNKVCRLPKLGDFCLTMQKARPGWMGKAHVQMEPREVLRFYPKRRFRDYFSKYQDIV